MNIISQFNIFDYFMIFIMLLSIGLGFWRGFTREFIALTAWVFAVLAAILLTPYLSPYLQRVIHSTAVAHVASFVAVLLVVLFLGLLINATISRLTTGSGVGLVDRPLGALFGLARGVIVAALLVLLIGRTSFNHAVWYEHSASAHYVEQAQQECSHCNST